MNSKSMGVAMLSGVCALLVGASAAHACSCSIPDEHEFLSGSQVPANAPVAIWLQGDSSSERPEIEVMDEVGVLVDFEQQAGTNGVHLILAPWVEGETYTVSSSALVGGRTDVQELTFVAEEPVAAEHSIKLVVEREARETIWAEEDGGCGGEVDAVYADFGVELPAALEPYRSQMFMTVYALNGGVGPYTTNVCAQFGYAPGTGELGRLRDRVWAACDDGSWDSQPGPRSVSAQIWLPGLDFRWETQTVDIELKCSGGGCSTTGSPASSPVWALAFALVALVGRRRR